eukprot:4919058-Pyramimonas_sp.AAC.1
MAARGLRVGGRLRAARDLRRGVAYGRELVQGCEDGWGRLESSGGEHMEVFEIEPCEAHVRLVVWCGNIGEWPLLV